MGARILVIEDHPDNLELVRYLLTAWGHTVLAEASGEAGMRAARRERPDLILCDVQLPGMRGEDVVRAVKADPSLAATPVVALTSLAMVGDREALLAVGFDGYLSKPITPETFVGQVESYLAFNVPSSSARMPAPELESRVVAREAAGSPAAGHPMRARILVVDDAAANRQLIRQLLEPYGYRVTAVESAEAALDILAREQPDLVLSDVHMHPTDGYKLLRQVQRDDRLREIPFGFISSSVWANREAKSALEAGAATFIARPVEAQQLVAEIERILDAV